MSFIRVWLSGYYNPVKMIEELRLRPAPHWGFYGQFLRAMFDSLLLYLPLAVMGRVPPKPSNLSLLPTEEYFWHLIWITPLVFVVQWLLGAAFIHVILRLSAHKSDFDQLLNIGGMAALIVGAFLLVWDWTWFAIGGIDQYFLGFTHLAISLWGVIILTIGLRRILGVSTWLGVFLGLLTIPIALPFGIMFMRSPM